jgi:hypothetical protein
MDVKGKDGCGTYYYEQVDQVVGNESSRFIKCGEFPDYIANYKLLKSVCVLRSQGSHGFISFCH